MIVIAGNSNYKRKRETIEEETESTTSFEETLNGRILHKDFRLSKIELALFFVSCSRSKTEMKRNFGEKRR